MAPKPSKRGAEPVTPGLQQNPGSSGTPGGASSSTAWAPVAAEPQEAPSKKTKWYRSLKGKKRLARAIRHRNIVQLARLAALSGPPLGVWQLTRDVSGVEEFRRGSRRALARALLFLLQVVIRLVTHYRPSDWLVKEYGRGVQPPPRLSILFMLEGPINEATWESLTSRRRQLFLRALTEGEGTQRLNQVLGEEIVSDIQYSTKAALLEHFPTLHEHLRTGKLPMLDFAQENLDKQYDNVWKEPWG